MKSLKEQAVIPSLESQVVIPENGISPTIPEQTAADRYRVRILNPDDGSLVEVDAWKKDPNPQRAEAVVITRTQTADALIVGKTFTTQKYNFGEAQATAAHIRIKGMPLAEFRCPTRHEVLDIFDAAEYGFDAAMSLIAGQNDWYSAFGWTCERLSGRWADRIGDNHAWMFYGCSGTLYDGYDNMLLRVGAVAKIKEGLI